jgi:tetratricopeptide (TPR) repeat protein
MRRTEEASTMSGTRRRRMPAEPAGPGTPAARAGRALACALLLLLSLAVAALAIGQGRILGTVVDGSGAPLAGVKVVITSPDMSTYHIEKVTDAHGQFSAIILDAARQYRIQFEKEGFQTLDQPLKPKIEETLKETYTLEAHRAGAAPSPGGAASAAQPGAGAPPANAAESAEVKGKNDAVQAYNDGVTLVKAKDVPGAIAKFELAAKLDPKLAAAPAVLAELYLDQHRPAEALAAADRAVALAPAKPRLLLVRYQALRATGDRAQAARLLDELAAHPAPDVARDVAVFLYNDAADATREKNMDAAVAGLKRAIAVDRTLEPAYGALATIYMARKDNPAALEMADRWLAAAPQSLQALQVRYDVLNRMKDPRAAAARKAMEGAKGDTTNPLNHGIELYNANRIPEATKVFEEVVQADPNNPKAHYMLGLCYTNAGDAVRARQNFETFLKLAAASDPDAESARQMLKELQ